MAKKVTDYIASPTLSKFHQDDTYFRGVMGPFGSGKSTAMCMEIVKRAREMPPGKDGIRRSRWAVIRNTYRELSDSTIRTWLHWFPEAYFGVFRKNDNIHYVKFDDVDLEVVFRALDKPEDVGKLLSVEYTAAWINEAREIPKAIVDALGARIARYPSIAEIPDYWSGIIGDTNPPDTDHWWYKLAEQPYSFVDHYSDIPEDKQLEAITNQYHFYKQPSGLSENAENVKNLHKQYYQRMMIGKSAEWNKVYVHGEYGFIVDGRPVYPEYADTIHCTDNVAPIRNVEIIRGHDFGLTPSCVFLQITPRGQVIVFDELISESMGIERFSDIIISHSKQNYSGFKFVDYGDPAGTQRAQTDEKTCFQILHGKGIHIEPGRQDLTVRHESVRKVLNSMVDGRPGFLLHKKCDVLRKGFMGGYQYKRMSVSGFDKYQDKPDKNRFSHPHDALQYALSQRIGIGLLDPESAWDSEEDDNDYGHTRSGRSSITGY